MAFSSRQEKSFLVTLTGEPDWTLLLWHWEKVTVLASIPIGITGPQTGPFEVSFNPNDQFSVCVTGPNVFKYYKIKDNSEFEADHT